MSCSTCPDRPMAGEKYEDTKCATCRLASGKDNPNNHGMSHIGIDTLVQREGDREYAVYEPQHDGGIDPDLVHTLKMLARMDVTTRNIVCWRMAHPTSPLRIVAKECGITVQAASTRLKNACRMWPMLKAAINYKHRGRDKAGRFLRGNKAGFKAGAKGGPGRGNKKQ